MAEERAVKANLRGANITESDGGYAIYKFVLENGEPLNVAIPHAEVESLLLMAIQTGGALGRVATPEPTAIRTLPVEWWTISQAADHQRMVISLRIAGGMEMSYDLAMETIPHMIDVLRSILGEGTPAPPETVSH